MRAFQYFEYYRHRKSVLTLSAISLYCIWYIVYSLMLYTQFTGCKISEQKYSIEPGSYSKYCFYLQKIYSKYKQSADSLAIWAYLFLEILLILPYFFFFLYLSLFHPHDCYECFNRLPGSRYSIYQYTKQELNAQYRKKMGEYVAKTFEEMIDKER